MIDFAALSAELGRQREWRAAHPEPLIWVTSLRRGALFREYTSGSPEAPFTPNTYVYVGREMPKAWPPLHGHPCANPHRLHDGTSRASVLARYRTWLHERYAPGTEQWVALLDILRSSLEPRGVALACWCAPLDCHGQIIREAVLAMYAAGWR